APDAPAIGEAEEPQLAVPELRFSKVTEQYRTRRRRRTRWTPMVLGLAALAVVTIGLVALPGVRDDIAGIFRPKWDASVTVTLPAKAVPKPAPPAPVFPRRMLAICVSNYLYAAPVHVGWRISDVASEHQVGKRPDHSVHGVFLRLADALYVR